MHLDYPNVPYCGPTSAQLQPGAIIRAKGHSQPGSDYMAISLQCGPSTNFSDDVALYLSLAFNPPPRVIRNSLIAGQWGPEESFGGFPTAPGAPFEIMIMVEPSEYRIAINGQHFTEYRHRIPFERITHVSLTGDARIDSFSIWYSQSGPSGPGLYPNIPSELGAPPPYISNPGFNSNIGGLPPYPAQDHHIPYSTSTTPYPPLQPDQYGPGPAYAPQPPMPGNPQAPYYPNQPYPTGSGTYPPPPTPSHDQKSPSKSGGIGNMLGGALTGVAGGIAANAIGKKIFGKHHHSMVPGIASGVAGNILSGGGGGHHGHHKHKHKKSSAIPIAGIAAGAGAAALGATLLGKAFKHKHKGSWSHKGWGGHRGSSSSSSSEEE
ncbi:Galectin [Dermatophagoides farinae]|uniref:Galectin n=1 Tax=Dermatophagoides farinae TaxID=6954 RepID=A0A922I0N7_DERFA|nr:galectin-9-like [Dermatophagoides farinae]KAH7638413.1 galectin-like protein 4 [Dermatophagoides farinae]KAH9517623.1 Galectin [Dermatophagoides farinae]